MALNFPPNPSEGQTHFDPSNGVTYTYKNGGWVASGGTQDDLDLRYVKVAGDNMTGDLTLGTDKIKLNAEDGSITAAGRVGIGTTGPGEILHIRSATNPTIRIDNTSATARQSYVTTSDAGDMEFRARINNSNGSFVFYGYGGAVDNEHLRIDSSGNVLIGGTLPASPNISLNADGTASFKKGVDAGTFSANNNFTDAFPAKNDSLNNTPRQIRAFNPDNSANYSAIVLRTRNTNSSNWMLANEWLANNKGDLHFIGRSSSANNTTALKLTSDGDAEFTGDMAIGVTGSFTPSTPAISLAADGNITGQGTLKVGDGRGEFTVFPTGSTRIERKEVDPSSAPALRILNNGNENAVIYADGSSEYAGDMAIGTTGSFTPSTPAISLNADGSAEFKGTFVKFQNNDPEVQIRSNLNANNPRLSFAPRRPGNQTNWYSSIEASESEILFAIANTENNLTTVERAWINRTRFGIGGTSASPNIKLNADGSAEFAGSLIAGTPTDTASDTVRGVRVTSGVNRSTIDLQSKKVDSTGGVLRVYKGTVNTAAISNDGSAEFAGNITAGNVTFNLEADDDTKYTATTDAEGEQTLVYNGAVLDMKEVGLALVALKSAAAAASDFATLKSAIATALANL